jgi:dipeptidase E
MKKMLIASTSTIYGSAYLDYLLPELSNFFQGIEELLFIPYARPSGISYDDYTIIAKKAFSKIGIQVSGIHQFKNEKEAIEKAEAIFTGGGNTFVLVDTLYKKKLMSPIKNAVENGTFYLGTSAGSNICGVNMKTTNDMPIVYPPNFKTLNLIPFNINPHYLDTDLSSKHKGETRETRIKEFHIFNKTPVIGLREGSWLHVQNEKIILKGKLSARFFQAQKDAVEIMPETDLNFLSSH